MTFSQTVINTIIGALATAVMGLLLYLVKNRFSSKDAPPDDTINRYNRFLKFEEEGSIIGEIDKYIKLLSFEEKLQATGKQISDLKQIENDFLNIAKSETVKDTKSIDDSFSIESLKYSMKTRWNYLLLRRIVGVVLVVLPIILILGSKISGEMLQESIWHYHHTSMRDIYVAGLVVLAVISFIHRGYEKLDDISLNMVGFYSLGLAFIPADLPSEPTTLFGSLNNVCSVLFYLVNAYIVLFLFTKSIGFAVTSQKSKRNIIYKMSGYLVLICLFLNAFFTFFFRQEFAELHIVLFLEIIAIYAIGVAWLTKGELIFKDRNGIQGRP